MKQLIFYFTATGNSLHVAKQFDSDPINIAIQRPDRFVADRIGFVFPVYCGEMPAVLKRFMRLSRFESPYIFAVATCGGVPGNALAQADEFLKIGKARLSYGASITLPDNCILFATPEHKKQELLQNESFVLKKIIDDVNEGATNLHKMKKLVAIGTAFSWFGMRKMIGTDRKKATSKCVGCGLCASVCPMLNIVMVKERPVFGMHCTDCFGCIQHCPESAIRFGMIRKSESSYYLHPEITVAELIRRNSRR